MATINNFPKLDRGFLAQTEQLIKNGEKFRQNRNWPFYLTKLKSQKFNYVVVQGRSISYFETAPVDSSDLRENQLIDVDKELELLKFSASDKTKKSITFNLPEQASRL